MKNWYFILLGLLLVGRGMANTGLTQVIRGRVTDSDTQLPLVGVTLFIEGRQPALGTITDNEGNFEFPALPIGRYNVGVSYIGYENKVIPNLLIGAGKEAYVNIALIESVEKLDEVVVTARKVKGEALNDMATVSARSISVEETQRFAGSFNDPSRLVSSYSGVMSDPDGNNDIIVRGNSPRGVQWRLEGVDVPNPNHFANEGATGGPISILNNTTLGTCDFFTGAFPADYGDAYSGVFDVHLRKGNNKKPEYTAQLGVLGTDLTAEGPLRLGNSASYLVNYRYSSLDLLTRAGIKVAGDAVPKFQDLTFNISVPTAHAGSFQLFGVGGMSNIAMEETDWKEDFAADMGVLGMNHIYSFNDNTYIKTTLSYSGTRNVWNYYESEIEPLTWELRGNDRFNYSTYTAKLQLSHKLSAKHTFRLGAAGKLLDYDLGMNIYDWDKKVLYESLGDQGNTELFESYANWKYRPVNQLTMNAGVHYKYLYFNGNYALEPRLGLRWQVSGRQAITAGFGMHSKTDNISIYLIRERLEDGRIVQQNRDLDFLRARHYVIGYENRLAPNLNLKMEAYYQDLYNVPVATDAESHFSILNESSGYIIADMDNSGTGSNLGMELALEKFFDKNYYFLVTTSLFQSKFQAKPELRQDIAHNTRFNNNYIANVVVGKEFPVGRSRNSAIGVNLRGSYAGGQWYTPIDRAASETAGYTVRDYRNTFGKKREDYTRFDLKVSFRRNKKTTTRVWELDIQNVSNSLNVTGDYWDPSKKDVVEYTQMGILPVLNYRIEF